MKYILNPFVQVLEHEGKIHFIGADADGICGVNLTEEQKQTIYVLSNGGAMEQKDLYEVFPEEIIRQLLEHTWIVPEGVVDVYSMDSRTKAFYSLHGMAGADEELRKKTVLILGCGGIGTHMAWHMLILGVKTIILVDFDAVEESNFNRQLLFEHADIGQKKIDVLKRKLLNIRPDANIITIDEKITDEYCLEKICTAHACDLIIKAADSPEEFPLWLDHVCKKHKLTYIAGITVGDRVFIGPSFLPDVCEIGWSDIIPIKHEATKLSGKGASFGPMLYHISDALAIESFKILSGAGTLKYAGNIYTENIFTGSVEILRSEKTSDDRNSAENNANLRTKMVFVNSGICGVMGLIVFILQLKNLPIVQLIPLLIVFCCLISGAVLLACGMSKIHGKAKKVLPDS